MRSQLYENQNSLFRHVVFGSDIINEATYMGVVNALQEYQLTKEVISYGGANDGALMAFMLAIGIPEKLMTNFLGGCDDQYKIHKYWNRDSFWSDIQMSTLQKSINLEQHPVALEIFKRLAEYKKYCLNNRKEWSKNIDETEVSRFLDIIRNIEKITFGEWGEFIENSESSFLNVTGIKHFSCAVTLMEPLEIEPVIFTSLPDNNFSRRSKNLTMISALVASLAIPSSFPLAYLKDLDINCMCGGIFLNLPYSKDLYEEDMTLLLNKANDSMLRAFDTGVYSNFGELKKRAMTKLLNKECVISEAYENFVPRIIIDKNVCLMGVKEHNANRNDEFDDSKIEKELLNNYEVAYFQTVKAITEDSLRAEQVIMDIDETEYGEFFEEMDSFKNNFFRRINETGVF